MTIGIDIVDLDRFRDVMRRTPRVRTRLFSEVERTYCDDQADPELHFASTFAAKEAVAKALGLMPFLTYMRRIEITRDDSGRPQCLVPDEKGSALISITHDARVTVAVAIATEVFAGPGVSAPVPTKAASNYDSDCWPGLM